MTHCSLRLSFLTYCKLIGKLYTQVDFFFVIKKSNLAFITLKLHKYEQPFGSISEFRSHSVSHRDQDYT